MKAWNERLQELEPAFSLDVKFDPVKGGVWECRYDDGEARGVFCCDFALEDSAPLFKQSSELAEYAGDCRAVAVFYAEMEEDDTNVAAAYAIGEALLSLVPGGFLFDPVGGELMHAEDAVVFFHEELTLAEDEEEM